MRDSRGGPGRSRKAREVPRALRPAAVFLVRLVARHITYVYLSRVVDTLMDLYGRREAQTRSGSEERVLLRRARLEVERVAPGYKRAPRWRTGGCGSRFESR